MIVIVRIAARLLRVMKTLEFIVLIAIRVLIAVVMLILKLQKRNRDFTIIGFRKMILVSINSFVKTMNKKRLKESILLGVAVSGLTMGALILVVIVASFLLFLPFYLSQFSNWWHLLYLGELFIGFSIAAAIKFY